jgi:hypothetical protein
MDFISSITFHNVYDYEHPTEYILKEITEHKNVVEECLLLILTIINF